MKPQAAHDDGDDEPRAQNGGRAMIGLDELVEAAAKAPPQARHAALLVLRGQAELADPRAVALANEPYLTLGELARRLKVSRITLWRWQIPGHDLGGHPLFRLSEIKTYLQSEAFQRRQAALRAGRSHPEPGAPLSAVKTKQK